MAKVGIRSSKSNARAETWSVEEVASACEQYGTRKDWKVEAGSTRERNVYPDSLADDMLYGAAEIAVFLWGDAKFRRRVFYLASLKGRRRMPVFRVGGTRICCCKSTLVTWIRAQEAE